MSGLLIGLTGGIAAGKSSVAAMFGDLGAALLDSDQIAHQVMREMWEPTMDCRLSMLIGVPPDEFSDTEGHIDRRRLGRIVFADPWRRMALEDVLHPLVAIRSQRLVAELRKASEVRHIVYESALLVEVGRHKWPDCLVVVSTDDRVRIARLMMRNGMPEIEAKTRLAAQIPQSEKIALADFVIDNSGTPEETRAQVAKVWEALNVQVQENP